MNEPKILLLYPNYRDSHFKETWLPVGLGYIAESLKVAGFPYKVIDLNIDSPDIYSEGMLLTALTSWQPQYLGVSMMSFHCEETYSLLYKIKRLFPDLIIIVGGPHVTDSKEKVLADCPAIDIGVIGEGEEVTPDILRMGLRRSGMLGRDPITELDRVPFPTYQGFKLERYGNTMPIYSSRGCPHHCIFCSVPLIVGRKWRGRSAANTMAEIHYWEERGYRDFRFTDSNFTVDKSRVKGICRQIISHGLIKSHYLADGIRADQLDKEILMDMWAAGFRNLAMGVESGSDEVMRTLKKGETSEQVEAAIGLATKMGYQVSLFFLIGSPGETPQDIKKSFRLAMKYPVYEVYFFNLTPLPGTELYALVNKGGGYNQDNFGFGDKPIFNNEVMSEKQLGRWIKKARIVEKIVRRRYYLRSLLRRGLNIGKALTRRGLKNDLCILLP